MMFNLKIRNVLESKYRRLFTMAEKQVEDNTSDGLRYAVIFMDKETHVQIAAATDDLDKFTKTDLMKMVEAFKEGVQKEENFQFTRKKEAEKELNKDDSDKRGSGKKTKRVRRPRKVQKP